MDHLCLHAHFLYQLIYAIDQSASSVSPDIADSASVWVVTLSQTFIAWSAVIVNPSYDLFQMLKAGLLPSVQASQELLEVVIECVAVQC